MRLNREKLIQHLNRITCDGLVEEAVFTGAFETQALTKNQLLLVLAPALEDAEALDEDTGVAGLSKFIKALSVLSGAGNEAAEVDLHLDEHRLVVNEGHRGILRLMTASPKTIGTAVEPQTVTKLRKQIPAEEGIALTKALMDGIRSTFRLFQAEEIEMFVGPKGGKIRVGNENSDMAEFEFDELQAKKEYSLLFGEELVKVLGVVTDYATARLLLGGPKGFATVVDGDFTYILSPKAKGADA